MRRVVVNNRCNENLVKRYLPLILVIFTLFGMLGVQVASASPLEVGEYSSPVTIECTTNYEPSATDTVFVTLEIEWTLQEWSEEVQIKVGGVNVTKAYVENVRHVYQITSVSLLVPAGKKLFIQNLSTGCPSMKAVYQSVDSSGGGGEGKEGKEGPEGKEGKEGPKGETGPKGESGTEGKTGPEGKEGKAGADGKSLEWSGSWSPTPEYKVLQAVLYNGSSYVALGDNKGEAPSSHTLSWELIAERGSIGTEGKEGKEGAGKEGPEGKTGKEGPEGVEGKEGKEGKEDKELELLRFGSPAETTLSELKETMEVIGWCIIGTMLAGMIGFMVYKVLKTDR